MRKTLILFVLALIPLWAISYVIAEKGEVDFDPTFERVLKEELQTNNLSKKTILSIESLILKGKNLTSVKGIENFVNLKELNLSNNLLTDSSFLSELNNLENLNLSINQFEEIHLNSPNLNSLNLRGNKLSSINFVDNLIGLHYLNLRDNDIEDLSPLADLTHLNYLNVRGNKVKSLEPLSQLENLLDLNIRDNQIHSIEPLVGLPLTTRLTLSGNDIDDLGLLEDKLLTIEDTDFEIDLPKPKLNKQSGFYADPFTLEIEVEDGLEVYYTLDGSTPNAQSTKYEGPIEISKELMYDTPLISNEKTSSQHEGFSFKPEDVKSAVVLKAVASYKQSPVVSREFSDPVSATFILDETLNTQTNLPIISLTVNPKDFFDYDDGIYVPGVWYENDSLWSGNYSLRGREFEKEGFFELFDEDKVLEVQQNVGLRINGRSSRRFPQKSLRIYARDDYGQSTIFTNVFDSLDYNRFDLLLLRNSGQDYNSTLLRDGLMHELVKDLEVDVQAYQPAIVLLNGEYWGIQNIREKFNKHYIRTKYNLDDSDLILAKAFAENDGVNFEMKSGTESSKKSYFDVINFVETNDMTTNENLSYVEEKIDLDNFLHYVAYQIYFTNTDSFSNNMMIWRKDTEYVEGAPVGHDGRWRWMLFDLDWGMGFWIHNSLNYEGEIVEFNMIEHVLKDEQRMSLFRNLMDNEQAKDRFIKIMMTLLDENFETNHVKGKIDELAGNIQPEIPRSIKRWENIESVETWEENVQALHDFAERQPQVVKEHLMKEFNLTESDIKEILGK